MTAQPDTLLRGERRREVWHDVVVVGAGLAGSGIAAALAQRGWDVLLIDRDRFPRHKVCGEFLSPEAQHSLQALGLLDEVAVLGPVPLHAAAITTPGGATVEMALPADAWGLSRYALDARLAGAVERHWRAGLAGRRRHQHRTGGGRLCGACALPRGSAANRLINSSGRGRFSWRVGATAVPLLCRRA